VAGQFVNSFSGSTGYFMEMTGHQDSFRNFVLGAAVISVGLNFSLVPHFGSMGAAFAAMASIIYLNIRTLIFIKNKYGKIIGYLPLINI
jgi:O-antigen/teichoic acid export membrane protein